MPRRRTIIGAAAGVLVPGCLGLGGPNEDEGDRGGDDPQSTTGTGSSEDDDPTYRLRAASAPGTDEHEPVLSTEDEAVAGLDPLVEAIEEASSTRETVYRRLSPEEFEEFQAVTADVEPYPDGNPPGYYFEHDGEIVSVSVR